MKTLFSIADNSYTDLNGMVVASNEDAVTKMLEGMDESYKLTTENVGGNVRISLIDDTDENDMHFVVGQTFDVPEGLPFVVVRHHAFEGVGFEVVGCAKTPEWAESIKRSAIDTYLKEEFSPKEGLVDFDEPYQSCFDTGYEWVVFTVHEFKEVA